MKRIILITFKYLVYSLPFITMVMYISPIYVREIRLLTNILLLPILFLSIVIGILKIMVEEKKRNFMAYSLILTICMIMAYKGSWKKVRVNILDNIIQNNYCTDSKPNRSQILGDVTVQGNGKRSWYVNETHCLTVVCNEERYSCK